MIKTARIRTRKIYISKGQTITNLSNHVRGHGWLIVFKPPYMKDSQFDCTKPLNAKRHANTRYFYDLTLMVSTEYVYK